MFNYKYLIILVAMFLFVGCSENKQTSKPTSPLVIKTTNGDVRFMVETASTPEEMKTGLMHRTNLGFNSGMIFNVYPVRPVAMWMKNTKIPLDMLFIAPDTSISMIKENATPMSEEHIFSENPVRAVIEINAGQVKRHGIKVGDKVTHLLLNGMVDIKTPGAEQNNSKPINANTNITVPTLKVEPKLPKDKTEDIPEKTTPPVAAKAVVVPKPVPAPSL